MIFHIANLTKSSTIRKLSFNNFSSSMKLKAVIFDFPVVISRIEPPSIEEVEEIQKESINMAKKSMESITKLPAGSINSFASTPTIMSNSNISSSPSPNNKLDVPISFKEKYADKINLKLAQKSARIANGLGGELVGQSKGLSSRWMFPINMGNLLDYFKNRSVSLCLIGGRFSGNEVEKETKFLENLKNHLKPTEFAYIRPPFSSYIKNGNDGDLELAEENWNRESIQNILDKLNCQPHELLLVSKKEKLMKLCKEKGILACRYKGNVFSLEADKQKKIDENHISVQFTARNINDIKDSVDSIIGISLRSSVVGF